MKSLLHHALFGFTCAVAAASAFAQDPAGASTTRGAYIRDGQGDIVRSQSGLCWRNGAWTSADAVIGCDGELVPPVARPTAPPLAPSAAATPAAPVVPRRCDFAVTLAGDQTFAFNRAMLTDAAKKRLDDEVLGRLTACGKIEAVLVTGHADRLGSQQYNQKLSEKRAAAVAAYLHKKRPGLEIDTLGAGETQPVTSCSDRLPRAKLAECLASDRRVTITVRGSATS